MTPGFVLRSARLSLLLMLCACGGSRPAEHPSSNAAKSTVIALDWPVFGHDPGGAQFSPANLINKTNVARLKVAWTHHSGDLVQGSGLAGTSLEGVPIYVNKALYYCTPRDRVFSIDPVTGQTRWVFDPTAKAADGRSVINGPRHNGICRGVAYWQDNAPAKQAPCAKRIFRADEMGRLFAIDADTGLTCKDFGPKKHPGYVAHSDFDNFGEGVAFITSPPAVIGDAVIVGGGANDGVQDANDGIVRAFDARTGALKWDFDPIPAAYRHLTGAANVWSTMSVDLKRGLVFLPTTSPSTDYYGGARKFDMPLTSAIVALEATSGKVVWSFQTIHHDLWDYDLPGHPLLVTIRHGARNQDVVVQQTKTGHLFVLDRATGRPVFPIAEVAAPQSTLAGESSAPTQPVPTLPKPYAQTQITRKGLFGLVGLDKLWCQREFDKMIYQGIFTPPSLHEYLQFPSTLGGGNWGGAAYDPTSNSIIVKASNVATRLHLTPKDVRAKPAGHSDFMTRTLEGPYGIAGGWFLSPLGVPCTPPPYGALTSISMDTGQVNWTIPLGQARQHGVTAPAFLNWGSPSVGGPIVTGGGLIFIAATMDSRLRALDVNTGAQLWKGDLPRPGMAIPMTYVVNGRQYVVIAAGGNAVAGTELGDATVAFSLPAQ